MCFVNSAIHFVEVLQGVINANSFNSFSKTSSPIPVPFVVINCQKASKKRRRRKDHVRVFQGNFKFTWIIAELHYQNEMISNMTDLDRLPVDDLHQNLL